MFYAIDGDEVGKKLEFYLASDQVENATAYSEAITAETEAIRARLGNLGARILFCGGDSILAESEELLALDLRSVNGAAVTWSVGIGSTPSSALLALKKAKALGRNQTVML